MDNLNSALGTWNGKLAEIWQLLSTTPENFKGGAVWTVMQDINGALQAIGCALLVLFFVMGIVKTCSSFTELKKPEMVFKCFIRFVLAQAAVTHGMELMTALFKVAQGMISTIMTASGMSALTDTTLPDEMVTIIEDVGFLESIPLWAITLLGSLFIWVLSLIMILTVYSRFFKLYLATAIAPIPMASFAGQPSSSIGVAFLKSYNETPSTGLRTRPQGCPWVESSRDPWYTPARVMPDPARAVPNPTGGRVRMRWERIMTITNLSAPGLCPGPSARGSIG